jgi:hypothetical protein
MMTVMVQDRGSPGSAQGSLAHLVDAIGCEGFGLALAHYLHGLCGADHVAAFRLGRDELREVAACCVQPELTARDRVESYVKQGLWKNDPAMTEAQRRVDGVSPRPSSTSTSATTGYDRPAPARLSRTCATASCCAAAVHRRRLRPQRAARRPAHPVSRTTASERLGAGGRPAAGAALASTRDVCQGRPDVAHALTDARPTSRPASSRRSPHCPAARPRSARASSMASRPSASRSTFR